MKCEILMVVDENLDFLFYVSLHFCSGAEINIFLWKVAKLENCN
jgi:hypothetical protein